jgi:hypothetical protein
MSTLATPARSSARAMQEPNRQRMKATPRNWFRICSSRSCKCSACAHGVNGWGGHSSPTIAVYYPLRDNTSIVGRYFNRSGNHSIRFCKANLDAEILRVGTLLPASSKSRSEESVISSLSRQNAGGIGLSQRARYPNTRGSVGTQQRDSTSGLGQSNLPWLQTYRPADR